MDFFNDQSKKVSEQFKLLGYTITGEPTESYGSEKDELFAKLYADAQKGKRGIVERLQKYISKYPKDAVLKNYLYIAYKVRGDSESARKILDKTIRQHPDYLFGKINLAGEYLTGEEFERVPEVLGEYMEIKALYPDRDEFHISEVMSFNRIAFSYFILAREFDQAENRLDIMKRISPDESYKQFDEMLSMGRLMESMESMEERMGEEIQVESFPTIKYPAIDQPPILQHEVLNNFYRYSVDNFPLALIDEIMALPHDSIIADLESIIEDASRRYQWYQDNFDEFDDDQQEFQIHALYFLAILEAEDSLSTILNFLRQGEDVVEYWYSDHFQDYFLEPVFLLGRNQLPVLKKFVLEPNLYYKVRLLISEVVAQIGLHQPERKDEVINWFKEVLQYHLDRPSDRRIIDTGFIGWTVCAITKMEAPSLTPIIEQLWNNGWISEMFMGNLESILEELIEKEEEHDLDPMPEDIYEFYSGVYLDRKVEQVYAAEEKAEMNEMLAKMYDDPQYHTLLKLMKNEEGFSALEEDHHDYHDYDEISNPRFTPSTTPIISKKIGRNEPCPCGTGKKYKKCCMNK